MQSQQGSYQPLAGQTNCLLCPSQLHRTLPGAERVDDCRSPSGACAAERGWEGVWCTCVREKVGEDSRCMKKSFIAFRLWNCTI